MFFITKACWFTTGFICGWLGKEHIDTEKVDALIRSKVNNEQVILYYDKILFGKDKVDSFIKSFKKSSDGSKDVPKDKPNDK